MILKIRLFINVLMTKCTVRSIYRIVIYKKNSPIMLSRKVLDLLTEDLLDFIVQRGNVIRRNVVEKKIYNKVRYLWY